jgi:uncharacterized membrane protein
VSDGDFKDWVDVVGQCIDGAGVVIVVVGLAIASAIFLSRAFRSRALDQDYRAYRQGLGRAILLGLEFLVAADIIRTVAVSPSFKGAGVLAVIVVIRTFLSMALQVEIDGRWPWQPRPSADGPRPASRG